VEVFKAKDKQPKINNSMT